MKGSLALTLISAVALLLAGCGPEAAKETPKAEAAERATVKEATESAEAIAEAVQATAKAASPDSAEPELVFRYGEVNGDDNIITKTGRKFAEYVKELSGGRMRVHVYPNDALGNERTSLRALQAGGTTIDMYRGNTNALAGYGFQKLNLFGLPYVFNDREGMWKVLEDKDLGQAFLMEGPEVGAGMVGLFYTDEGPRNLFTSQEIKGMDDIRGKKIRVPESVIMMDTLSALGARPVPMPYSQLYDAIKNGVVDGGENPLTAYVTNKLYEAAPYYLLSGHVFSPGILLMAEDKWDSLSSEDQKILLEAGRRASEWNRQEIQAEEARLLKALEGLGVTVMGMSPEDEAKAREETEIVRTSFSPGLEDLMKQIKEIQK